MHSPVYAAFLRGINVGGKNKLPMKDLAAMFTAAGCSDVRTYIQSGNVVFRAGASLAARLPAIVSAEIASKFGLAVPLVLRTLPQMIAVVASNPFLKRGAAPEQLHVVFLADTPTADLVTLLDPDRSPPDSFHAAGAEIYLHLPNGAGNSKLTNAYFDSKLRTMGTARNWRTVNTLLEMMQQTL